MQGQLLLQTLSSVQEYCLQSPGTSGNTINQVLPAKKEDGVVYIVLRKSFPSVNKVTEYCSHKLFTSMESFT